MLWVAAVLLISLTACQPQAEPEAAASPAPTYTSRWAFDSPDGPSPTRTPRPTRQAAVDTDTPLTLPVTATIVFAAVDDQPSGDYVQASLPTPALDPLRIVFPTPGKPPVSAWRPALYPVPWAQFPFDHFYFSRPTAADEVNWPLWDYRYGGIFFENVTHTGIDIPVPAETAVLAAGSGKVIWAGYGVYQGWEDTSDPYGLAVVIQHDFGYQNQTLYTLYGHLNRVDVAEGQHVETGDVLGRSGNTGKTTGPHLHFEVRLGKNSFFSTRNPELWLAPPQGWGVIAGRVMNSGGILAEGQTVILSSQTSAQNWIARTYGLAGVNSDAYYQENLVVSDLPAGMYDIRIPYMGTEYRQSIEVLPGLVNYFSFYGKGGFEMGLPPDPGAAFTPAPEATPSTLP